MSKSKSKLSNAEIQAIVGGYHTDPFAVLGPHKVASSLIIRLFHPFADEAEVVFARGKAQQMTKVNEAGLFELTKKSTAKSIPAYTFKLKDYQGVTWSAEDVYRFDSPLAKDCLLYTSPSPRDKRQSRMPSSA